MPLNPADTQISNTAKWTPIYVRGQANTASLTFASGAETVTPSSVAYVLLDPQGTTIASGAASVTAGLATYALTSVHIPSTTAPSTGWVERWTVTLSDGSVRRTEREVVVSIRTLEMPTSHTDLLSRYPTLANHQARSEASFQAQLEGAWGELLRRLQRDGVVTSRLLTPSALRDAHEHLALVWIFRGLSFAQKADSNYGALASSHQEQYEAAYARIRSVTDNDDSGSADDEGDTLSSVPAVIFINASNRYMGARSYRGWW